MTAADDRRRPAAQPGEDGGPPRAPRARLRAPARGHGAHRDRRRHGLLGFERSLVHQPRRPGGSGPRAARLGRHRARRPVRGHADRLPPPPLPGDPDLRHHPRPAGRRARARHRCGDQRLAALDRHPRTRHAPAGRVREARRRPLPGPLARPTREGCRVVLERARPVRAARRSGLLPDRRRAGPRDRRRLRGRRGQHLLHGRRQRPLPGRDLQRGGRCGLADDRRDELPDRADPDLPRPVPRPARQWATTRSRRCSRWAWAGSPASASARAARSSSTCRRRQRTSSSRSSARSGASSGR